MGGGSLDLFTDGLGSGRLFSVRTAWGWVWSNRAVAALLFADLPAVPDPTAWAQSAVADEFYGNRTPFQGVRVVGPATHIRWSQDRLVVQELDTVTSWLSPQGQLEELIEHAASDLTTTMASIQRWYPGTPVVDLSGGRDSRLVAAGFLAGGTDVMLHSHDAVPGDLMVARDLVARLGRDVAHWVEQKSAREDSAPPPLAALERARAWHSYAEGLRPASFLHYTAPAAIDSQTRVTVGGAGGEVAHSYYGTAADAAAQSLHSELLDGIENPVSSAQMLRAFAERIVRRHGPVPGVRDEAREALVQHVATVLGRTQEAGVYGSTLLDHFYVLERMRRWGTAAERHGVVSPLLTPSFQRAALALHPHQRRTNELHRRLTELLVPQWKGVPYFPGEMPQEVRRRTSARRVLRLTDCTDARAIEAVLASPDEWNYPFDSAILADIWRRSAAQETSAADETVIRLAVWRAAFQDYTAELNGTARPRRQRVLVAPERGPKPEPEPEPEPEPAPAPAPEPAVQLTPPARSTVTHTTPQRTIPPRTSPTVTALLLQTNAARRVGRSRAWSSVRDTRPGRHIRHLIAARR